MEKYIAKWKVFYDDWSKARLHAKDVDSLLYQVYLVVKGDSGASTDLKVNILKEHRKQR
jgi:hypothetical protein